MKPEGAFEKTSESKGNYRDLSPSRPVIHKLKDHLKVGHHILQCQQRCYDQYYDIFLSKLVLVERNDSKSYSIEAVILIVTI